jgi:phosphoribosylglycinamide formyltransferase-1
MRVGVLCSGRGSNLQSLLDAAKANALGGAQIAVVVCNVAGAGAIERAKAAGVAVEVVEHKGLDRVAFERALVETLRAHKVELVCLAGFMRIVGRGFLDAFPDRVLNIHPSLLPSFPGLHAQRQAIEAGARFSGCTIHFVDAGTDSGPILLQAVVPVLPEDTEDSLAARILVAEHRIYPEAVKLIATGKARVVGRRARVDGAPKPDESPRFNPPPSS